MERLAIAAQTGVPLLLWGEPGTGKTATVRAVAESLGWPCEIVIAAIREPSDFAGLPVIATNGHVRFAPPAWTERLAQAGRGILFLDEISCSPPSVQAALLRVVLDRVVGDLPLPEGVAVIAAANPPEQAAGGWDLAAALSNRFCHLDWRPPVEDWIAGMTGGWPTPAIPLLPAGWEAGIPKARALVAAFIRARPSLLHRVPSSEEQAGRAWPSRRTWDMAARLLAACEAAKARKDTVAALVTGCVGDGAGLEFLAWREELDLPDPEELLSSPEAFSLPNRGDRAFAVLSAVVAAATANLTPARWAAAWKILASAAVQGAADIAAAAAQSLARARRPDLPLPVAEARAFLAVLKEVA